MQLQSARVLRGPFGLNSRTAQLDSCDVVSIKPSSLPSRAGRHRLCAASSMDVWSMDDDLPVYVVAGDLLSLSSSLEGVGLQQAVAISGLIKTAVDSYKGFTADPVPVIYNPAEATASPDAAAAESAPLESAMVEFRLVRRPALRSQGSARNIELYLLELFQVDPEKGYVYATYMYEKQECFCSIQAAPDLGALVQGAKAFKVYGPKSTQMQ